MTGFAFVDKNNGNVDFIISWTGVDTLPSGYPIEENQEVIKIENYNNDFQNYEAYDLVNKMFNKRLSVTVDKVRTLLGSAINIQVNCPSTVNELIHLKIGTVTQDIYTVNGVVNFSYAVTELGFINIEATSSTIYGKNSTVVEILN